MFWSLLGTDRFDFRISSSGMLTFRSAPDFESPHDSNRDNIYRITVRASDGRLAASVNVTVTVTNVNERPEVDLAITDQTMTVGVSRILSLQGTFSDPDTNDTLSYSANSSNIRVATASVSNSDITLTLTALSAGSATITVTVADRTSGDADRLTASQAFTVTVDEPNAPPTFEEDTNPTRSVAENTPSGADVGSPVTASDDDSDTLSYSLSGTDAGSFRIGRISGQIRTFDSLNFETRNSYSVIVTADDGNEGTDSIDVTITVTNLPPTIAPSSSPVNYDEGETAPVATYRASDPGGGTITWSLLGTDQTDFNISGGILRFNRSPDYESPHDRNRDNDYEITVIASDGDLTATRNVTIRVVNRPPTRPSGSSPVNYDEGETAPVATYRASDPGGGTITWTLDGSDADAFRISQSGVLRFKSPPDFENPVDSGSNNEYSITVIASDTDEGSGLSAERSVTVRVMNLAPTITSGAASPRYAEGGTGPVATYRASDPGGGAISWSIPAKSVGTDKQDFEITRQGGVLSFKNTPDYEAPHDSDGDNDYTFKVRASDDRGSMHDLDVTVTVTNVNERPEVDSAIADRTMTAGDSTIISLQGTFNDPDDDTLTYTAETPDTDVATVSVIDSMLTIERVSAGSATITVTAADRASGNADQLTASQNFAVTVEAQLPTVTIAASTQSVGEGQFVPFTLSANPAPTAPLIVNVRVADSGSFLIGPIPTDVTIAGGRMTALFTVETEDDSADEANGTVMATVLAGTGYSVGSPSSASVAVRDDDLPSPPQLGGVSASSSSGDTAEVRWIHRNGIAKYKVQYRKGDLPGWRSVYLNVSSPGSVADRVTITGLECETRYRFRVRGWGDGVVHRATWGPYSDIVYATTGDCGPVKPPPTPNPDPPIGQYAPLVEPPGPAYECRSIRQLQPRVKHSGPRVTSADGRHVAQIEIYSTRRMHDLNSYCIEARIVSESSPGADRITWGGKLYKTERFLNLEGLSLGEIGLIDYFTLLDRYEDQQPTDVTPVLQEISRSCETCRGGMIQTEHEIVDTKFLKVPTIYALGEHTFSAGGAPVPITSRSEWRMPVMGIYCSGAEECLIALVSTINSELSEDIDTGLLGDSIDFIAGLAEFLDEYELE